MGYSDAVLDTDVLIVDAISLLYGPKSLEYVVADPSVDEIIGVYEELVGIGPMVNCLPWAGMTLGELYTQVKGSVC